MVLCHNEFHMSFYITRYKVEGKGKGGYHANMEQNILGSGGNFDIFYM